MIRTPDKINVNDTIDLIAPSFGCSSEPYFSRLEKSIKTLNKLGYQIKTGENVYLNDGFLSSNSALERAKEFMEAYLDESKAIISVGGGEVMMDMLDHIDFDKLKQAKPKWFMGFSDNTNLTFLLPILANTKAIYGVNATAFISAKLDNSEKDSLRLLNNDFSYYEGYKKWGMPLKNPSSPLSRTRLNRESKIYTKEEINVKGTLLGGCLDIITCLIGTKYDKVAEFSKNNGPIIWILECCDLNPLSFYRSLMQMRMANYFENTKAIIIGRPFHYDESIMGVDFIKSANMALGDLNIPLAINAPFGHLYPSLPFVVGAKANLTIKDNVEGINYEEE